MAITRPVTRTVISTAQWGVPITDAVNTLRTDVDKLATSPAWVNITYTNGFSTYPGYAPLSYRMVGNLVFLRGGLVPGATNVPMGTLPAEARPANDMEVITYAYIADIRAVQFIVKANGQMSWGQPQSVPGTAGYISAQIIPWLKAGV